MNRLKQAGLAIAGALMLAGLVSAQTPPTTVTNTFTVNRAIPDGDANGIVDVQNISLTNLQLYAITDLQVTLQIAGGTGGAYNGDFYAYLMHGSGFAVLLNRVGKTSGNSFGYSDSGFTITLSDASPNDIHLYQNVVGAVSPVTGTWSPDGRHIDPSLVLDSDPRAAMLSSFNGVDPSGDWTLFLSDVDFGQQGTLVNWGLVITAVPEPGTWTVMGLGLGGLWLWRRKRK